MFLLKDRSSEYLLHLSLGLRTNFRTIRDNLEWICLKAILSNNVILPFYPHDPLVETLLIATLPMIHPTGILPVEMLLSQDMVV